MVKAEEKFARVTVACIGEAAVRRRQEAGGRISGTSDHTLNQTVLVRLPDHKHEGMDHGTIRKT